jgi:glycosyltransferase involved in cell wall biosynthesis
MVGPGAPGRVMRIALIGDGQSPHLLKWARALRAAPQVELWVASSRGFHAGFDGLLPAERRLALGFDTAHGGGNVALLKTLPRLGAWLRVVDADWLHAHYLTSHGTLAWLARRGWRLRGQLVGSAWGSDILVTPAASPLYRWLTGRVLRACRLTTSDSLHMAQRMREMGAREVMTFPFGLEALPPEPPPERPPKPPWLFFANRGLEPIYRPEAVLAFFARVAQAQPEARLIVANEGSLAASLPDRARALGLTVGRLDEGAQVEFVGRLSAPVQAQMYARAQWFVSLPASDSVSVSLLEALAHGCIPVLSDLPANREWVRDGENGMIVAEVDLHRAAPGARSATGLATGLAPAPAEQAALDRLLVHATAIARQHRARIESEGLFAPAVLRFLARLQELSVT